MRATGKRKTFESQQSDSEGAQMSSELESDWAMAVSLLVGLLEPTRMVLSGYYETGPGLETAVGGRVAKFDEPAVSTIICCSGVTRTNHAAGAVGGSALAHLADFRL
jgi:hypothetical protein